MVSEGPSSKARLVARVVSVDRVTAEVVRAFDEATVRVVLLKGPSFQRWLYDARHERGYADTDLLVAPAQFIQAEELLRGLGFEHDAVDIIPGDKFWHAHTWIRPSDGAVVDLHRSLLGIGLDPTGAWEVLSAGTEEMEVAGVSLMTLDESRRALHVTLHLAQGGLSSPKNENDLRRALERVAEETWTKAAGLAERLDAVPAFLAGLQLLPEGEELATRLGLRAAIPRDVRLRSSGAPPEAVAFDWLANLPGPRAKLAFVMRKAFPPVEFMRSWSPWARRSALGLVMAYVSRPFSLLVRTPHMLWSWWKARG